MYRKIDSYEEERNYIKFQKKWEKKERWDTARGYYVFDIEMYLPTVKLDTHDCDVSK